MFRRKFCAMLAGVPLFGRFMKGAAIVKAASVLRTPDGDPVTLFGLPVVVNPNMKPVGPISVDFGRYRSRDQSELATLICEAVGEASMCWEHVDRAGVFNTTLASQVASDLTSAVDQAVNAARGDRAIGYHEALDVVRATLKANHAFREGLESVIAGRIQSHCFGNWGGTEFSENAARSVMELLLGVGTEVSGTNQAGL